MGVNFWWIYDAVTVMIIILSVYKCGKRGFSKIVVTAIGCVLSLMAAYAVSKSTSGMIYDKFIKEKSIETVRTAMSDYRPEDVIKSVIEENELSGIINNDDIKTILDKGGSVDDIYEYADNAAAGSLGSKEEFMKELTSGFAESFASTVGQELPPYVVNEVTEHLSGNEKLFRDTVEMIVDSPGDVAEFIEKNYIRDVAERIVSSVVFLVVFFVLMAIVILVAPRAFEFGLLNGYDRLDRFVGGLLGLVAAVAGLIIIAMAIKIMVNMTDDDDSFVSLNTIKHTKLFRRFYDMI